VDVCASSYRWHAETVNVMASENQGGSPKKTSPRRLLAAEKQRRALEMKIAGATLEQIAAEVGYKGPSGAYQAIQAALKAALQPPADELRRLQYERLERLYQVAHKKAVGDGTGEPDWEAMDRAIKIMQRIHALFGLEVRKVRLGGDEDAPPLKGEMRIDVFADIAKYASALALVRQRGGLAQGDLPPHGSHEPLDPPQPDGAAGPLPDEPLP
jgi:hypothetical protein